MRRAILVFATVVSPASASDIFVPTDYPTIQEAIDAAVDGDVVNVLPGTYREAISFEGKAITVRSTHGPDFTLLKARDLDNSAVRFINGEGRDSMLSGFKISDGTGYTDYEFGRRYGGAIVCIESEPTIRGNILRANEADYGGAVFCTSPLHSRSPLIEDNVITANRAIGRLADALGGGVYVYQSRAVLRGNRIQNNHAADTTGYGFGGGVSIHSSPMVLLEENEILANSAGSGAGVDAVLSHVEILSNRFEGNLAAGKGARGAGLLARQVDGRLENNLFLDNHAAWGTGGAVIALNNKGRFTPIRNNLFHGNTAYWASALFCTDLDGAILSGNTFTRNTALDETFGNTVNLTFADYQVIGDIFWDNPSPTGIQCSLERAHVDFSYCDLEGGVASISRYESTLNWGSGMLDVDPQFVDPANADDRLSPSSPLIDAGDPAMALTGQDLDGHPRGLDGDLDRAIVVDIGAYEFSNVHLAVSGNPTPGGTLTFETTGTSGLSVTLWYGTAMGAVDLPPYGQLFVDLNGPWGVLPFGSVPSTIKLTLPPSLPTPIPVVVQELAIDPATLNGNLSNAVEFSIE